MTDKKEEKKPTETKKTKVSQTDKYYKIKADFGYLAAYNYKITKEIGRGGYGVVYKVNSIIFRPSALKAILISNTPSKSTSTLFQEN